MAAITGWYHVAGAMRESAAEQDDVLLALLMDFVESAIPRHWDNDAEGCDQCDGVDSGPAINCPAWVTAQQVMLTWLTRRANIR